MSQARYLGLRFLAQVAAGRHVDTLSQEEEFSRLSREDRGFVQELVYGCLRQLRLLDYLLAARCSRPLERLDSEVRWILRLGAYQIRFLRVPEHAAVHTSVELARRAGFSSARGLVNAVLRNLIRKPPELPRGDDAYSLAIRYSHPEWLAERVLSRWGLEQTLEWLNLNNQPPRGVFWVNPRFSSASDFVDRMRKEDPECRLHEQLPQAVYLHAGVRLPSKGSVEAGFFMDEGSQEIVRGQLPSDAGDCADLCAAPGGKSFLLASELGSEARLVFGDRSRKRLRILRKRASGLGFHSLDLLLQLDIRHPPFPQSLFDFVLLDVPCTGLGTIRSNPDIRWRVNSSQLKEFQERQVSMLKHALELVKPGGRLVYSTCSTEPEENEKVVEEVIEGAADQVELQETWRNFPGSRSGDCFFRARLGRK